VEIHQARVFTYPSSFAFSKLTYTFFHHNNANGPHLLMIHGGSDASWLILIVAVLSDGSVAAEWDTLVLRAARQSRKKPNGSAAYINMKTYKIVDLASM